MTERHKFIVWRGNWLRGDGEASYLLRSDGHRCCLGFLGRSLKVPDDVMRGEPCPSDASGPWPAWLVTTSGNDTRAACRLMNVNDQSTLGAAEREAKLTALFAEYGVDVEFRDGFDPDELAKSNQ